MATFLVLKTRVGLRWVEAAHRAGSEKNGLMIEGHDGCLGDDEGSPSKRPGGLGVRGKTNRRLYSRNRVGE